MDKKDSDNTRCFQGLTRDDLPKPYSSLQAVDLTSYGDDEYLAKSVAHYLNVQGPFDRACSCTWRL